MTHLINTTQWLIMYQIQCAWIVYRSTINGHGTNENYNIVLLWFTNISKLAQYLNKIIWDINYTISRHL